MKYRKLGTTDLDVSVICLGTMTWGEQNNEDDGFAQMNYSFERGVNFFDTAEVYSIPTRAETYGNTEEIIGNWFAQNPHFGCSVHQMSWYLNKLRLLQYLYFLIFYTSYYFYKMP